MGDFGITLTQIDKRLKGSEEEDKDKEPRSVANLQLQLAKVKANDP